MEKLTIEQCNALPIEALVIAVIVENGDSENARAFAAVDSEACKKQLQQSALDCRRQINSQMGDLLEKCDALNLPKENPEFFSRFNLAREISIWSSPIRFSRPSVLYKCPDGKYLDLNGYGNSFYDADSLENIKPFSDYFTRDEFRFVAAKEKPQTPNQDGIHIDMKWSADGFERYKKDIEF